MGEPPRLWMPDGFLKWVYSEKLSIDSCCSAYAANTKRVVKEGLTKFTIDSYR